MKATILAEIEKLTKAKAGLSISIVGAGGKTSLMRYLADRLQGPVICTTSTKLSVDEAVFFDRHIVWTDMQAIFADLVEVKGNVLVTGEPVFVNGIHKLSGLTEQQLVELNQISAEKRCSLIIEADGSKRRPLKAPADWEPVIPALSDLVIVVVGLDGLMKPLNEENVFRSQIFGQLTGLAIGQVVDLQAILCYLQHPLGGLKGIPEKAKRFALFIPARCESPEMVDLELIEKELTGFYDGIFIESVVLSS